MVEANTEATTGPGPTPPSFGPPSIPYVPPITFDEVIVRARVAIRRREKRGARLLVIALLALILPLLQAFSEIFPENPYATVSVTAYLFAAGVIGYFLFIAVSSYRIATDRPRIAWVVLPVSAAAAAVAVYLVVESVLGYLDTVASGTADAWGLFLKLVSPVCLVLGGALALGGAFMARPRRVSASAGQ